MAGDQLLQLSLLRLRLQLMLNLAGFLFQSNPLMIRLLLLNLTVAGLLLKAQLLLTDSSLLRLLSRPNGVFLLLQLRLPQLLRLLLLNMVVLTTVLRLLSMVNLVQATAVLLLSTTPVHLLNPLGMVLLKAMVLLRAMVLLHPLLRPLLPLLIVIGVLLFRTLFPLLPPGPHLPRLRLRIVLHLLLTAGTLAVFGRCFSFLLLYFLNSLDRVFLKGWRLHLGR